MNAYRSKLLSLDKLKPALQKARSGGKIVVFTNGCFDILHRGHVSYLEQARSLGDLLVVGLNSDDSVRRIKGPDRPIFTENDRAAVLAGLTSVSYVTVFGEDTPLELITTLRPDVLVKGADWKVEDIVGGREVLEWGGEVRTIEYLDGYSSSDVINRMNKHGQLNDDNKN